MAKVYAAEKSKYGDLTGQIIIWPVEVNPSIDSNYMKQNLPAGYLRCDGTVYNVVDYPQLAAICGAGTTGKFVRRNINGDALQFLTDDQFVVPDLGSKYPKPTTGPDAGQYKSIRKLNQAGNEISRSGLGIEATATLGTSIQLTYSGTFVVPSQTIPLKGKPSWSVGTQAGKVTDTETVDASAIAGHMHFFAGVRSRLKATNELDASSPDTYQPPTAIGQVGYFNASTVPIDEWLENTKQPGASNFPGNNQPPCRGIGSNKVASSKQYQFGSGVLVDSTAYSNACWNNGGNLQTEWFYYCLTTEEWNNYPLGQSAYGINNLVPTYISGTPAGILGCLFIQSGNQNSGTSKDVDATYIDPFVPLDWKDVSLSDVVPLNSTTGSSLVYATLFNEFSETTELDQEGDPTAHAHKVTIDKGDHTFALKTDPLEISPDALTTTLNLSVDTSASLDTVSSPFIVLEYLIKV
tara:strand:+ start:4071 stop:5465 length:1395 start_codon:yes stop_codon:yes gene_type:complete